MTNYIGDLSAAKPSDNDAVADGAKEIRDVKSALKNTFPRANSALDVSNDSINTAIKEDVPALQEAASGAEQDVNELRVSVAVIEQDINELQETVGSIEQNGDSGTTRPMFASVTHKGGLAPVDQNTSHNIKSIDWVEQVDGGDTWKYCRVEFDTPLPGGDGNYPGDPSNGELDANVNIQVTPFSNANNSLSSAGFVMATVTNIDKAGCEIAFAQYVSGTRMDIVWWQAFCLTVALN